LSYFFLIFVAGQAGIHPGSVKFLPGHDIKTPVFCFVPNNEVHIRRRNQVVGLSWLSSYPEMTLQPQCSVLYLMKFTPG
jgi:hypothetical protein